MPKNSVFWANLPPGEDRRLHPKTYRQKAICTLVQQGACLVPLGAGAATLLDNKYLIPNGPACSRSAGAGDFGGLLGRQ